MADLTFVFVNPAIDRRSREAKLLEMLCELPVPPSFCIYFLELPE
jgi:hypothetical protein